ncbi:hypothetical protein LTS07_000458 [Exophiala sideris]|uniref:DUF1168 domain-containing protein n=1 Tax=Exophiala sideris TaxID=1016849 RepID=A0ABR0JRM7_9EURO|nr:hypothetical protein LTS07_000458 [Exophiala sideris]KAK5068342.1 hypothetical protein LTR69_000460 [Exophiala sideris]KAK5187643.1 hypothetical protein LTR44_000459 [Eurotiomycetes sp. CCFEE 6388]
MSEPIPESIPTSADRRSNRPVKRARGANTALLSQAHEIDNLFLDPNRPVDLPPPSSATKASIAAPPEIVANVQGSSAGAGSGEFHVYKASRRREYERLRAMDEEAKQEEDNEKWEREEKERRERDEERTRKNREKRNRKKGKKEKGGAKDGGEGGVDDVVGETNGVKRKAAGLQIPRRGSKDDEEGSDFGVAEVVKEVGITIHEDD